MVLELDLSQIVGIVLMSVGTILVLWGLALCYTTKVRIRNQDPKHWVLFLVNNVLQS